MKSVLFNIHDVALLLRVGECSMLALLFFAHRGSKPLSHALLAVFLILNSMIALHVLMLWGEAVRFKVFDTSPNLFFIFSFAYFLQGPVLYWYTRSLIYKDFKFVKTDILHLIPTLLAPLYLYFVYYRHPLELKRGLALNFEIYGTFDWNFNWFVHAEKTLVVIYGAVCLYQVLKYRSLLKHRYSDTEKIDLTWLLLLIGGFFAGWLWILMTHIVGYHHFLQLGDFMAIVGNYLIFILINVLIFYSLLYSNVIVKISDRLDDATPVEKSTIDPNHVARINHAMAIDKLFLNSRLTLDEFSKRVELPPRQVSAAINGGLKQNFHEFVNSHRVEEAKRILRGSEADHITVIDIATISGFNSKAAFNRFFKKFTGMTPTQYRASQ